MLAQLGHFLVASLLIISQTGLLINAHYCQGEAKQATFFVDPGSCHSAASAKKMPADCPMHGHMDHSGEDDNGCCSNQSFFQKISIDQLVFAQDLPEFSAALSIPSALTPLSLAQAVRAVPSFIHPPPKWRTDLTVLLQVFRL